VHNLTKSFNGRGTILNTVSFDIKSSESVALIGGNGSGKSTLLRCCLRLIEADGGEVVFLGDEVSCLSQMQLRKLRSKVGLVFQKHNLIPRLSVLTNVIHGAIGREGGMKTFRHNIAPGRIREEAMDCLEKVGLAHLACSRADCLSGGESQRVAIARALMQRPQFIIADEPVASLDPKIGMKIMELFRELNQTEKITLLYVSHDLEHAIGFSDRILGLQKGNLVLSGDSSRYTVGELNGLYQ
jgi:phosphonate transport system ATP-binding protein